jgi:hypothetical protein
MEWFPTCTIPITGIRIIVYHSHPTNKYGRRLALIMTIALTTIIRKVAPMTCHIGI